MHQVCFFILETSPNKDALFSVIYLDSTLRCQKTKQKIWYFCFMMVLKCDLWRSINHKSPCIRAGKHVMPKLRIKKCGKM